MQAEIFQADEFEDFKWWLLNRRLLMPKSARDYVNWARHADRSLSGHLATASAPQLLRYMDSLKPTAGLRNNVRTALIAYFDWLISTGARKTNPASKLTRFREKRRLPKPINGPGALVVEAAAYGLMWECLVIFYLHTGLRRSEVCFLRWSSIIGNSVHLVKKGGDERAVFLNGPCIQVLERWKKVCPSEVWLFPSPKKQGHPITPNWAWEKVRDLGLKAGIEGCRPHRLRHTFGTTLYRQTRDLLLVKEALGHANLKNTMIYTEICPFEVQAALEQLTFDV